MWIIQIAYHFLKLICVLVTFLMTVAKYLARRHFREEGFPYVHVLRVQTTGWRSGGKNSMRQFSYISGSWEAKEVLDWESGKL